MNPNLPSARRRHFSCPDSTSRAESKLVPVLLRITAEPESAYVRFNALAYYALVSTRDTRRPGKTPTKKPGRDGEKIEEFWVGTEPKKLHDLPTKPKK